MRADPNLPATAFLAHLPPPVTGASTINDLVRQALLGSGASVEWLNLTPPGRRGTLSYGMRRFARLGAAAQMLFQRRRSLKTLYMPLDGGVGLIINLLLMICARLLRLRIYLHHHSFAYITRPSVIMRCLTWLGGGASVHIFLCDRMKADFEARYRRAKRDRPGESMIISNHFAVQGSASLGREERQAESPEGASIVIGHLSNLSLEKGAGVFLDLFEQLVAEDVAVRGIVGGPSTERALEARLKHLCEVYSERLTWLGPVYDLEKDRFYDMIDIFVFPTMYANEAQPLVLFEAVAAGCAILATGAGCISSDFAGADGLILADRAAFQQKATGFVRASVQDLRRIRSLRPAASTRFSTKRNESRESLKGLVKALSSS